MSYSPGITVVIPHIPVRGERLLRALTSVDGQTLPPAAVHIEFDHGHTGSAATRNRGLPGVCTQWTAFLDDDDELLPHHLDELLRCAEAFDADVVYPGCHVAGGYDPHDRFGLPFDPALLRKKSYIPVTSLVRTELIHALLDAHGEAFHRPAGCDYDDWGFYLRLLDADAKFVHHPVKTWVWNHWGVGAPGIPGNTSGLSSRW